MLENLNQKRKYIKKQNLNLNKTNFKIYSFKRLFFFSKRVYSRTILFSSTVNTKGSLFYWSHLSNPNDSQVIQWPLQTP